MPEKEKKGRGGNRYYALTAKQEALCVAYVQGGARDKSAAYRAVYDCSKMKPETINRRAHFEFDKSKIKARVQELMEPAIKKAEVTAEYVLSTVVETIERCRQAEVVRDRKGEIVKIEDPDTGEMMALYKYDAFAVLKGAELLGKYLAMFTEKKILQNPDGTGISQPPAIDYSKLSTAALEEIAAARTAPEDAKPR